MLTESLLIAELQQLLEAVLRSPLGLLLGLIVLVLALRPGRRPAPQQLFLAIDPPPQRSGRSSCLPLLALLGLALVLLLGLAQ